MELVVEYGIDGNLLEGAFKNYYTFSLEVGGCTGAYIFNRNSSIKKIDVNEDISGINILDIDGVSDLINIEEIKEGNIYRDKLTILVEINKSEELYKIEPVIDAIKKEIELKYKEYQDKKHSIDAIKEKCKLRKSGESREQKIYIMDKETYKFK